VSTEKHFMLSQVKAIEEAKYLQGCAENRDPGDPFVLSWIERNAEDYRALWNRSKCKGCSRAGSHKAQITCEDFKSN